MDEYNKNDDRPHDIQESCQQQSSSAEAPPPLDHLATELQQFNSFVHLNQPIVGQYDLPSLLPHVGAWMGDIQPDPVQAYNQAGEYACPQLLDGRHDIAHDGTIGYYSRSRTEHRSGRYPTEGPQHGVVGSDQILPFPDNFAPMSSTLSYTASLASPMPAMTFAHAWPVPSFSHPSSSSASFIGTDHPGSSSASMYSPTASQTSTVNDSSQQALELTSLNSSSPSSSQRVLLERVPTTPRRRAQQERRRGEICYCRHCPIFNVDNTFEGFRSFRRQDILARHLRTQHDPTALGFRCNLCGWSDKRSDKVVKHIRAEHPDCKHPVDVKNFVEAVQPQPAEDTENLDASSFSY